jgi:arylsulfatase A-like enzyme
MSCKVTGGVNSFMEQREKPNIVLMVMDCARADHMSCYGYHRQTTPYLDQLASKGVLYENAISPAPWSLPAHWSIFTGLFPARHGVWNKYLALSPQYQTIAQILGAEGYDTAAFSNNPYVGIKNGFGRGFAAFEELFRIRERRTLLNLTKRAANKILLTAFKLKFDGAYRTNRMIKRWLTSRPNPQRPFFFFVNYMEPHEPYQPPWPYRSRFIDERVRTASRGVVADYTRTGGTTKIHNCRLSDWDVAVDVALYDAELAFLDAQLHSLFSYMEQRGFLDNSLLIITSDHGHSLGEHGYIGHAADWLYDTQVRVPLILYGPQILPPATRVPRQVQLVDIVPTILAMLGSKQGDWAHQLQGQSLLPEDQNDHHRPFTVVHARYRVEQGARERELMAIRTDDYKYIWTKNGHDELYHIKQDPAERHNVIDQTPTKVSELQALLRAWLSSHGPVGNESQEYAALEVELDQEVESRLRALGYIE